ncbi:PTS system ascorbate-specific IIB component [Symbiobacterium terraclitae]|uniref:PTS system ascorbate-specific IIB component n=1 Tax=Symbiobacterium terraclitae TaxID=557451 RepID=A0ABS4JT38_9FIRM|nr:PTS system ascorbate-specific IIB component [Symbiobacterium terraclitae]
MKILAVCGMGLGSSLMLRMQVEGALKELGIAGVSVEVADIATAGAAGADVIVTSPQFAPMLSNGPAKVVAIRNYMDKEEVKEKVRTALGME